MKNNNLLAALILLVLISIGFSIWSNMKTPKIAYVKSGEVVEKYKGMLDAKNIYKEKMAKWQANIDTLQGDYQRSISSYNTDLPKLSNKEKAEREQLLRNQENNLRQYTAALDKKAAEEDQKMTEGVLNQINSHIKVYGESNGYDAIFGTTSNGNLLYGKDGIDITEEILKELNGNYMKEEVLNK
jgi:outer membrane protein